MWRRLMGKGLFKGTKTMAEEGEREEEKEEERGRRKREREGGRERERKRENKSRFYNTLLDRNSCIPEFVNRT